MAEQIFPRVLVVVETPDHEFTQHPGQPASTFTAYQLTDVAASEALAQVAKTVPIGSRLVAFDPEQALAAAGIEPTLVPLT